jgi:hypothetical protein
MQHSAGRIEDSVLPLVVGLCRDVVYVVEDDDDDAAGGSRWRRRSKVGGSGRWGAGVGVGRWTCGPVGVIWNGKGVVERIAGSVGGERRLLVGLWVAVGLWWPPWGVVRVARRMGRGTDALSWVSRGVLFGGGADVNGKLIVVG